MHPVIKGLWIFPNFINDVEEEKLKRAANNETFQSIGYQSASSRRVQQYGYKYNYLQKSINEKTDYLGPLPEWSTPIEDKIMQLDIVKSLQTSNPNQLIVNEYKPGQGISWHTDAKVFDNTIVTLSTGSSCIFEMKKDNNIVPIFLEPKTLVVMTDESRWTWQHRIPARAVDRYDNDDKIRHTRISFTYRWVPIKTK